MKKGVRNTLMKYGITFALGGLMVWLVLDLHGYAEKTTPADSYLVLSNAFTIPGMVLLMAGFMTMISNTGALDGITYALKWLRLTLLPIGKQPRYADHVEQRKNRPKFTGAFLFVTGAVFLSVAVFYLIQFYGVYTPQR